MIEGPLLNMFPFKIFKMVQSSAHEMLYTLRRFSGQGQDGALCSPLMGYLQGACRAFVRCPASVMICP